MNVATEVDRIAMKVEWKKARREYRLRQREAKRARMSVEEEEADEKETAIAIDRQIAQRLKYKYSIQANGLGFRDDNAIVLLGAGAETMNMDQRRRKLADINAARAADKNNLLGVIVDDLPEYGAPTDGSDYHSYHARSIARVFNDMSMKFTVVKRKSIFDKTASLPTLNPGERSVHDDDRLESIKKIFTGFKEIATRYMHLRNEEIALDYETAVAAIEEAEAEGEVEVEDEDEEEEKPESEQIVRLKQKRDAELEEAQYTYSCRINYIMQHCALLLEHHTFSEDSGVSNTLDIAHKTAFERNWFNRLHAGDFEFIPSDPSLTPGSNYYIKMLTRMQRREMVTFHADVAVHIMVGATNGWNRNMKEPNENVILVGDKASGKSYLMERVKKNVCEPVWTNHTASSTKSSFNHTKDTHMFTYNDDSSLLHLATNKDSRVAEADRQQKTAGRIDYTYTEIEPKRRQVTVTSIRKGYDVMGTNTGQAEVEIAAGRSGAAAISATISRSTWLSVNTEYSKFYDLMSANSKEIQTPEFIKSRDDIRDENSLIWLICGHVHMLLELLEGHFDINMTAAETLIPVMMKKLADSGITEADNRQVPKIMRWCKEWVIRRTIVETFLISTGSCFKTIYRMSQLIKIPYICCEDDVILAFSAYFSSFYPEETSVVIKILMDNVLKSSNAMWKGVKFMDPAMRKGTGDADAPSGGEHTFSRANAHANAFQEGLKQTCGPSGNIDAATSKAISRMTQAAMQEANESNDRNEKGAGAGAGAANTPTLFHYVAFVGKTRYDFANMITSLSKENNSYRPSSCQINYIIHMLHERMIDTRTHYLKTVEDKDGVQAEIPAPYPETHDKKIPLRGIEFSNGNTYVNIEILSGGMDYAALCVSCIRAIEFECTIPRRVLTCIPDQTYRWLPRVIELKRTDRKFIINNPCYESMNYQLILTGNIDPEQQKPIQRYRFIRFNEDIDTHCIKNWVIKSTFKLPPSVDAVEIYHPAFIQDKQRKSTEERVLGGFISPFVCFSEYPKNLINDYNEIYDKVGHASKMDSDSGFTNSLMTQQGQVYSESKRINHNRKVTDSVHGNTTLIQKKQNFKIISNKAGKTLKSGPLAPSPIKVISRSLPVSAPSNITTTKYGESYLPFNDDSQMPFETFSRVSARAQPSPAPDSNLNFNSNAKTKAVTFDITDNDYNDDIDYNNNNIRTRPSPNMESLLDLITDE